MTVAKDHVLDFLLDFNGREHVFEGGYYVKFEIRQVAPSEQMPHGIRYSFTMHEPSGWRILGYDNAHAIKAGKPWDHRHGVRRIGRGKKRVSVRLVQFVDAETLLDNFYTDVEALLDELGLPKEVQVERTKK